MYMITLKQKNLLSIFPVSCTACKIQLTFQKFTFEIFDVEFIQLCYVNTIDFMLFIGPAYVCMESTLLVRHISAALPSMKTSYCRSNSSRINSGSSCSWVVTANVLCLLFCHVTKQLIPTSASYPPLLQAVLLLRVSVGTQILVFILDY